MKSFSCFLLSAALFVASVSAQLTVNTPTNVAECEPLTITWSGGTAPYFLSVHSGNDINGTPLLSFPSTTATSQTWPAVNFTSGTILDLSLRDSGGLNAQSALFTVQTGIDSSCLSGGAATTGTQPAAGSTTTGASATATPATPAATATTPAASGSTPSTAKAAGSSSSAAKPSSTNAAMATGVTYGAAGILGVAIAAVFI